VRIELALHLHVGHLLLMLTGGIGEIKGLMPLMRGSSEGLHVCGGGGENARAGLDGRGGQVGGGVAVRGGAGLSRRRQGVAT